MNAETARKRLSIAVLFLIALVILGACTPTSGQPAAPPSDLPETAVSPTAISPTDTPVVEIEAETETEAEAETETETAELEAEPEASDEEFIVTDNGVIIFITDDRSDRLRGLTRNWNTNWNRRTISTSDILSGGPPRDGIPSIDNPQFIDIEAASEWLAENEPVIVVEIDGDVRAYPLQILTWHEIVNDNIGGVPAIVTFCPLCNAAIVFDRQVDGEVREFGVSGLLRNSDLIMYDRTTESLWQQFTGEAIIGDDAGKRLTILPSGLVSFADFSQAHPDGVILSRETGFVRSYGQNPYVGYDTIGQNPFLFTGELDGRLPAVARVVTVEIDDVDVAYPLFHLSEVGVIHDTVAGQDLVIFHQPGTASALGARIIAQAEDVGAVGVFDPFLNGERLTFSRQDEEAIIDDQTGSVWNILGQAIDGPLAGAQLTPIIHANHFWFAVAAFKPDTIIYQP